MGSLLVSNGVGRLVVHNQQGIPAESEAEKLSRRAEELAQIRLDQLVIEANQAGVDLMNLLQSKGQEASTYIPSREELDRVHRRLRALSDHVVTLKRDLGNIQEVVSQRTALYELQKVVMESFPKEETASLLLYLATVAYGSGGVAYGLSGFPGFTLKLVPAVAIWLVATAFFLLGYSRLSRWQRWKFMVFQKRFDVPPPSHNP
jgi:hypothetical protein